MYITTAILNKSVSIAFFLVFNTVEKFGISFMFLLLSTGTGNRALKEKSTFAYKPI